MTGPSNISWDTAWSVRYRYVRCRFTCVEPVSEDVRMSKAEVRRLRSFLRKCSELIRTAPNLVELSLYHAFLFEYANNPGWLVVEPTVKHTLVCDAARIPRSWNVWTFATTDTSRRGSIEFSTENVGRGYGSASDSRIVVPNAAFLDELHRRFPVAARRWKRTAARLLDDLDG